MNKKLQQVAAQFAGNQTALAIEPLGNGLINDTYRVRSNSQEFVLQRINPQVFPQPQLVMDNLIQLGRHIQQKPTAKVFLQIPELLPTQPGEPFYLDDDEQLWRALQLIQPAESRNRIHHIDEAGQIGFALAHFHHLCADLCPSLLHDTLPGFHITPGYLLEYKRLIEQPLQVISDEAFEKCIDFIETHQGKTDVLEDAKTNGALQERVIHGDPKLNNFLFEPGSTRIVSLIDLDTVKPGLLHYDIADCLRSCCHDKHSNRFDLERCRVILQNYLRESGDFFSAQDCDYLYDAIWLIPFELGLRFFNDYLSGDRYFKTAEPQQNLTRALAQFALCDSIEQQQASLQRCISHLKGLHLSR